MNYTAYTKYTLVDMEVGEKHLKPTVWPVAIHLNIDTDAGWYADDEPVASVRITGFSVQIGDEWVKAHGALEAMIEAAFVIDEDWLLETAKDTA